MASSPDSSAKGKKADLDAPLSKNEPTSGPAGSSYETYAAQQAGKSAPQLPTPSGPPQQPTSLQTPPPTQHAPGSPDQRLQAILDSGFQSRAASRPGRDAHDIADAAQDLGSKAKHGLKTLTTTQKALGVGLLAAGVAFLLARGSRRKSITPDDERGYRPRPQRSPFADKKPRPRPTDDEGFGPLNRQPWGTNRYAAGPAGKPRVQSGSDPRRAQGPGSRPRPAVR